MADRKRAVTENGSEPTAETGKPAARKKALTLEESFSKLDGILEELEKEEISLEEAFRRYQEGMKLLKACNDTIDRVEKKVWKLNEEGVLDEF